MADESMTEALKEAYATAPADDVAIACLELAHPSFVNEAGQPDSAWATPNEVPIDATLEPDAPVRPGETVRFTSVAFRLKMAPIDTTAKPQLQLQIDNVSRFLIPQLDRAAADYRPITLRVRTYLESDLSIPQKLPVPAFTLSDVKANLLTCVCTARIDMDFGGAFPKRTYTAEEFPALVGA